MLRTTKVAASIFAALSLLATASCSSKSTSARGEKNGASGCVTKADCVSVGIGEPIFIGTQLSTQIAIGRDSRVGVELALDYLDGNFDGAPGTIDGHEVVLLTGEDDCSGSVTGAATARRLLAEPKIIGVVGTTCSGSALNGAVDAYSESHVLLLSPSNTAPELTAGTSGSHYYFRIAANDLISRGVTASFVTDKQGWKSAVTIEDANDPYSSGLASSFARELRRGGTRVTQITNTPGADQAPIVQQISQISPQVIFIPTINPGCASATAALRADQRTLSIPIIVGDGCQEVSTLAGVGPNTKDLFATGLDTSVTNSNAFYKTYFLPAFISSTGLPPTTGYEANAFDAANLLFGAIRAGSHAGARGSTVINRVAARDAMLKVNGYSGLSGKISCIPSGDCIPSARIGIYRAPFWPAINRDTAQLAFSKEETLLSVRAGG
ncbi:unannotated protein [freshwater metagenome]|uniref:Unannotated protein n=1 Tax=freshwater metagenome TaxID=449393 RepID=A0A6J6X7U6_9ZZZZ|nr:ABC transporter substrate-binding protein [Actinomycetota bacterium]